VSTPPPARQFTRFLIAGGLAAGVNYGSRFIFSIWLSFPAAILLAYCMGMVSAFLLMRRFVFDAHGRDLGAQVLKFLIVNVFAAAQTLLVSLLLVRWVLPLLSVTWQPEALAHAAGVAVPVLSSFVLHKRATFR
jgi:putative flippase GtrA